VGRTHEGVAHHPDPENLIADAQTEIERKRREAQAEIDAELATQVLIIEDEPVIAADIEALVKELGHNVIDIAATRSEAVEAVSRKTPGLVLADIQLADGSSGIEAVNDILTMSGVPIVFITAYEDHAVEAFGLQAVDYVMKPIRAERLRKAVRRVCSLTSAPSASSSSSSQDETIPVELGGVTKFVHRSEVRYVEAYGDYVRLK